MLVRINGLLVSTSNGNHDQANLIIDEDPKTVWSTEPDVSLPQEVIIDLGEHLEINGFTYLPKQSGHLDGTLDRYAFYTSTDGASWGTAKAQGEFSNIHNNNSEQRITFKQVKGRYIKFIGRSTVRDDATMGIAELGVITN